METATKKVFFHGTSADNLQAILENGLSCDTEKIWTCSEDAIYLWDAEKIGKEWDCETPEDCEERAFQMAFESGQIACAKATDCRIVVLRIELDESEVCADTSCENMEGSGAACIYRDILPDEITDIKVSNDFSLLKGYFMSFIYGRDYCNLDFSKMEIRIIEAMKKAEIYPEDIDDLTEWEVVKELQT